MAVRSYLTVLLLCLINLLNYMDRFTIAGVLKDIQNYFKMSDAEGGLLQTVFICSYMIFAPIFGFIGDRYSRKIVIIGGVTFWSSVTLLSSFVQEHHTLMFFLFRGLVGVGEASYSTVAPTIIADLFFGKQRSTMIAFFYFAIPVGSGLGYIVGSKMALAFGSWHWALRFTPVFGYACVLMYCFMPEPKRGEIEQLNGSPSSPAIATPNRVNDSNGWRDNLNHLKKDLRYLIAIPTYLLTTLGFTSVCFSVGALSWWAPKFMASAVTDMSSDEVALRFGIIACVGGLVGVLLGSVLSQTLRPRYATIDPLICGSGVMLSIPFLVITLVTARSHSNVAWLCVLVAITLLSANWALVADILLYVVGPGKRSSAAAFQILISHLLGDASSPFIVGLISNIVSGSGSINENSFESLQYALIVTPVVLVLGAFFFLYAAKYVTRDELNCKNGVSGSDTSLSTGECTPPALPENSALMSSASNANLVQRC